MPQTSRQSWCNYLLFPMEMQDHALRIAAPISFSYHNVPERKEKKIWTLLGLNQDHKLSMRIPFSLTLCL